MYFMWSFSVLTVQPQSDEAQIKLPSLTHSCSFTLSQEKIKVLITAKVCIKLFFSELLFILSAHDKHNATNYA